MTVLVEGSLINMQAASWVGYGLELVLKSACLLVLAHVSIRALSRWPAAVRSHMWTTAFILLAALPVLVAVQPTGLAWKGGSVVRVFQTDANTGTLQRSAAIIEPGTSLLSDRIVATKSAPQPASVDRPAPPAETAFRLRHWPLVVAAWLIGLLCVAGRAIYRFGSGLAVANQALPATDGKLYEIIREARHRLGCRPVEPRIGASTPVPFVTGLFRVYLVFPACAVEWTTSELRAVVLHELAHVKRRDLSRLLLAEAVTALYWFNPLAWIAARRSALIAEMACDDVVCHGGRDALQYARQLLRLARSTARRGRTAHVPSLARRLDLEVRMRNILEPATEWALVGRSSLIRRYLRPIVALGLPVLVALFSLPVAVVNTVSHVEASMQVAEQTGQGALMGPVALRSDPDTPPLTTPASKRTIHEAARDGDLDGVVSALALDPNLVDTTDDDGMTPLALAAWNGHLDLVQNLLERRADPDVRNHNGLTPLFCAVDRARGELSMLLIRGGANLGTRGYRGRTLLHMAARSGDAGVARTLIRRGADVNAADISGVTSLDLAVWHGHLDMEELLVDNGAVRSSNQPPSFLGKKRAKLVTLNKSTG